MLQTDYLYHRCNPPVFKLVILFEEGPDSRGETVGQLQSCELD
jgi:hypothetical protein